MILVSSSIASAKDWTDDENIEVSRPRKRAKKRHTKHSKRTKRAQLQYSDDGSDDEMSDK